MFVDTRVEGYETIVTGVAPGAEVVLIDASGDGVAQMAQALAGRTDITAIHIVGHGQAGVMMLGSATLGAGDIDAYAGELRAIGGALAPDGDIQLWGCEIGAGPEGAAFIQALAAATGADIAASDDLTGAGGDWVLETQTGTIETSVAITPAGQHAFAGTLAIGSENFDSLGLITTFGTTLTAGNWQFTSGSAADHAVASSPEYAVWLNNDGGASDRAVILNYNGDNITNYAMKSSDGTNFALQSFKIGQSAGATQTLTIAAYSNGVQVVAPETVNLAASDSIGGVNYALGGNDGSGAYGTLTFSSAYANIDEIRFVFGGLSDLHIDDIAVAPAVVDVTAPVFVSAAVNGATLVMTYNEAITLDAVNAPAAGRFAVMADGASVTVNSVTVNAAAKTVTLTLQSAVTAGQAVTVAYTDPTGGDDASAIQDAVGNDAASLPATSVTNNTVDPPPLVSGNIAVPADGSYAAGQTLSFTVTFTENVTVVGTDSVLGLTIGSTAREAVFASSTANSVTYAYTVQAGDTDANGVAVGALNLNTSTIRDVAGNDANLALGGHVPSTAGVLVDTTVPEVATVSVPSGGTYAAGQTLSFTVNFDDNVTVAGTDSTLALTIGATARTATYLSKTANSITYTYTVQAGETDADGITVGALSKGSSTIRDAAGNDAVLTLNSVGATSGVLVDATVPTVSGNISVPTGGMYMAGQTLSFTVTFDENVTLSGSPSTLGLTIGAVSRSADITGTTGNSITYSYTVQASDYDADGIAVTGISLNGGTIRDGAGNNADLTLSGHLPSLAGVLVDGGPPAVSGNIAVPANGSYGEGATLTFTVTFGENVTVTGSDSVLGLTIGSIAREATYASSSGASVTYAYTVQPGETDANGIAIGAVNLNTSTIKDAAGNHANLALGGHVPATSGILVDTTAPGVASVSVPSSATYVAGQNLDFIVNFDEAVTIAGSDSVIALMVGSTSRSATFFSSSGSTATYRYTVQAGDVDADGITVGALSKGSSTIRDSAGNDAELTLNSVGATNGVMIDGTVPSVTGNVSVPANDTYVVGETPSFTVTFDENVTVTGTGSTLGLTIGATARTAAYASKTANSITYTYTVQAGDNDADGIVVNGISLNGGTIRDGAGNNANLSLTGHIPATTGVLVDTAAPSFTSATVNGATLVMTYSDAGLLDAGHAPGAGAFTVMVGGAPVSVTAVAVNGAAHTVSLTLASPVAAGAAVTVAYVDPTAGDDVSAIQDAGRNDAASLAATSVTNTTAAPPTTPPTTPPVTTTVDGVPVQTQTSTASDGSVSQIVTVLVVQPGRVEQVGNNTVADIPLVKDGAGQALLALQVPVGYGLQASGAAQPKAAGDALSDLIREIRAHTNSSSQDQGQLGGAGTDFVNGLGASTPLLVQTIVTTGADAAPGAQPLTISGQPQAQGQPQTALVIDGRSNPGIHIELQNVEFAAIIGSATVTGGAGSQHVWGDGASQTIFLGADDDVLHGGGGNDTVGSAGGNDEVYGDDGDDVVVGGEGADFVHGNAGNDTARGDAGDDLVYGGKGDDQVFGGADNDLLFGDLGQDTLQGNTGHDTLDGGADNDLMFGGQNNDLLLGGEGDDRLNGDLGNDTLQGNVGRDTLEGGAGADFLYGGQDNDVLSGGEGADTLFGDRGDDTLIGGAGADLFVTASGRGEDQVLDFAAGDRVGLLAGTTYSAAQVGGDTVITLTGGGQTTLVNVQLSGLGDGWITTI
ncbi:hypothetical protein ASE17_20145 [Phenylobacterium sp. Root77]|uniref:DUF4347 domain-containing protein n=1 Tax=unclassified Phenylobacterium TaxID=2640670 RepID=UPI0006FAD8BB|nr:MULTISPECIES: DUF4347 domain-containing protein [unclassified Phenylobacterium]KQW66926.1 hypothetical protein ASC73_17460 [Phenylobacterium sp. Root1277]KQW89620.1 hypothetical protein ASC79_18365 [Phenylobacterium sp. Root1290]KRC43511.1 hypothetical protein ASE17_20145 [Phenylobacterium sp. Root77]